MVSRKSGSDEYVPDTVYISGIPEVFRIERLCRMRIKENDPTPVTPVEISEPAPPMKESGDMQIF
jgi:hypothetical protein